MAHRQYFLTDAGASFYRTRMLSAGDPLTLSGPAARLQLALGNVTPSRPRKRVETVKELVADPVLAEALEAAIAPIVPPIAPPAARKPRRKRAK